MSTIGKWRREMLDGRVQSGNGVGRMIIGGKSFDDEKHTYVMGILNVTPDSFSDGGRHAGRSAALEHAERMLQEGADIVDVGGESTRPGYTEVSEEEEMDRILSVVELIKERLRVPVSVDTYKPRVAEAAIEAGADLINDIWGLQSEGMGRVIARHNIPCCLMHNRRDPLPEDERLAEYMQRDMQELLDRAASAGISRDKIILDPGIGFAKSTGQNLQILRDENFMLPGGYPVLLGTSRKSVIGNTLGLPVSERLEGTLVTTVLAVCRGTRFIRVHDVKENVRAVKMAEAIMQA